jgi:hypothetical protein
MGVMPDNEDELNLKWQVDRHDGEIDGLQKRITELEDDLSIVIRFALGDILGQARNTADPPTQSQWSNSPAPDPKFQEKCQNLVKRYGSTPKTRD